MYHLLNIRKIKQQKLFGIFKRDTMEQIRLKTKTTWLSEKTARRALYNYCNARCLWSSPSGLYHRSYLFNEDDTFQVKYGKYIFWQMTENMNVVFVSDHSKNLYPEYHIVHKYGISPDGTTQLWFDSMNDLVDYLFTEHFMIKEIK